MKIRTNNVPRDIIDGALLTPTERAKFDYVNWSAIDEGTDSASFFRYRGELYDLSEFMRIEPGGELASLGWEGCSADSAFSGTLVKISPGGTDQVIVGYATW